MVNSRIHHVPHVPKGKNTSIMDELSITINLSQQGPTRATTRRHHSYADARGALAELRERADREQPQWVRIEVTTLLGYGTVYTDMAHLKSFDAAECELKAQREIVRKLSGGKH